MGSRRQRGGVTQPIRWHQDDPALFAEAVRFTAARTGFPQRLIEKDYFCSVILEHLAAASDALVFKGGTCLAKVHTGFHRLSEDLDFSIPMPEAVGRAGRSKRIEPVRKVLAALPKAIPAFRVVEPFKGANLSMQYNATLGYESAPAAPPEIIKIEIGLREPVLAPTPSQSVRTALINPLTQKELVPPFPVPSLSFAEAMAEKIRAALCRRDAAIRDFFDIDHAVQDGGFDPGRQDVLDLVRRKIVVRGTGAVDVSDSRLAVLRRQVDAELRPVVLPGTFEKFDLDRAFRMLQAIAEQLV